MSSELSKRKQIEKKYKWDINDIYSSINNDGDEYDDKDLDEDYSVPDPIYINRNKFFCN
jgi:hypothetical protein